jgi:hypothetical protein
MTNLVESSEIGSVDEVDKVRNFGSPVRRIPRQQSGRIQVLIKQDHIRALAVAPTTIRSWEIFLREKKDRFLYHSSRSNYLLR